MVLVAYLVTMGFYISHRSQNDLCKGVDIIINDRQGLKFVTAEDINLEIGNDDNCFLKKSLKEINTYEIEQRLNAIDKIESVNCVIYNNSRLRIEVTPLIPVARIFEDNKSYYINKDGKKMVADIRYQVDVPIISGQFDSTFLATTMLPVLTYVQADSLWNSLISGIKVDSNHDIIISPMIKGHVINFGDTSLIENKFERIKTIYKDVMPVKGWTYYDTISVKWRGQVVATRRDKRKHTVQYTRADSIDNEVVSVSSMDVTRLPAHTPATVEEDANNPQSSDEKKTTTSDEKESTSSNEKKSPSSSEKKKEKATTNKSEKKETETKQKPKNKKETNKKHN